jgi:hypothetical protein
MTISPSTSTAVPSALRKRKAHTKSRRGCSSCKTRRVKCDEGKPACRQCKGMSLENASIVPAKPCLLPYLSRVRRVLRVWRQGRWLDIHGRELLRFERLFCVVSKAPNHNEMCVGTGHLPFVQLPTTEPILHDCCTLQWVC